MALRRSRAPSFDVDEALAALTLQSRRVLGQRRAEGVAGGGDGDADEVAATFRYFVGFHPRAIRCASAI